jgi:DNA-binding transcriptional MerR regulator
MATSQTIVENSISDEIELAASGRDETRQIWFSIGDLAREFGVTLRTLRFYEDKGLVHPRRDGLNRIYGRRDRARLKLVLMGKRVGFSLTEIRGMLDLYDLRDGQEAQLKIAFTKFNEQITLLQTQKRDIEQAIEELRRTVEIVGGMLKTRQHKTGTD